MKKNKSTPIPSHQITSTVANGKNKIVIKSEHYLDIYPIYSSGGKFGSV